MSAHPGGSVFSLGIDYTDSDHDELPHALTDAEKVEKFFAEWGFRPLEGRIALSRSSSRDILDILEGWADDDRGASGERATVLYVAGHGRLHNGRHYILTHSSPKQPPYSNSRALNADDLAQIILNSGSRHGLLFLDACYSAFAAQEVQQALDRTAAAQGGQGMDIAVLVPSLHHEVSYSGLFVDGILTALKEGSRTSNWNDGDEFVTLFELREELRQRLGDDQCAYVAGRDGLKIVPNPRYRAGAADRSVELGALLRHLPDADREHFLQKVISTDAGDVAWFFSGRTEASRRVLEWLNQTSQGLLVITGSPGAGKSAFLGRLAVLADPGSRPACHALGLLEGDPSTQPSVGTFDAVVHLKNRRVDDIARDIGCQIGVDLESSTSPPRDLIETLNDEERRITVMADALDEAEQGDEELIGRDVLRAIAGLPGCRVIVGSRRDRDGRQRGGDDDQGPLLSALHPRRGAYEVLDLDREEDTDEDIAAYVRQRLSLDGTIGWPTPDRREQAGRSVSRQARRIFLYARFAVRVLEGMSEQILDAVDWQDSLPTDVGRAGLHQFFAQDLERFADPELVREALTPLALARGKGIPRRQVWPALASALSRSGRAYSAADISRVIREAGWYLIEATEDAQAVFRLYHQAIADYLREERAREP